MSTNVSYISFSNAIMANNRLSTQIEDVLAYAGINRFELQDSDVCIGEEILGENKDYLIIAMIVNHKGMLYRFNYHPARKSMTLVTNYKLNSTQAVNLKDEVEVTLKSLRRFHASSL